MFENYTLPWGPSADPGLLTYNFATLTTMSFPMLISIGGDFLFAQNPSAKDVQSGFPTLSAIRGNLDLTGNFNNVEIAKFGGKVHIETTSASFQCPTNLQTLDTVVWVLPLTGQRRLQPRHPRQVVGAPLF
jgi:hypothetical protein